MTAPRIINTPAIPIDNTIDSTSPHAVANSAVATALAGKSDESTVVTNTSASITLTLADNTIYQCTNAAITDLSLSGVIAGFVRATLTFTSPSTATTFAMPASGWYCVGPGCENGTFTPEASMRYNLAIEQESDRIAIYVMEAL